MREIPYTSKLAYAEDGRALALNYSIWQTPASVSLSNTE